MRTETRKVLVEQEIFIANDGMEFTRQFDCERHEYSTSMSALRMYDTDGQRTTSWDNCWYVDLETKDDLDAFMMVSDFEGSITNGIDPNVLGIYMYNDAEQVWINVNKVINNIMSDRKENTND